MRPRRAKKGKRKNYAAVFSLGSDDSGSELDGTQDVEADVEFDAEEGQEGSDEDEPADDDDLQDKERESQSPDDGSMHNPDPVNGSDDEPSSDEAPTRNGRQLPKRAHVHEALAYPEDLTKTRLYDGPLKLNPRHAKLFTLLYGPDPDHIKVFYGMFSKWFHLQVLPSGQVGEGGVMSSPWLAEDFEEKSRHWSRMWYERSRASKLQRLRKIRPDHVDMFKPQMNKLFCVLGRPECQKQVQTNYGFGRPVAATGHPLDTVDARPKVANSPTGWLLDTGGIPLAIGWAPSTGRKEQFIAVCSVPFSDQEPRDANTAPDDPEEKKRGTVQIWSIPCHLNDGSDAILVQSLSFDWGRPKRLQWCPVPSPDETSIGLLAILAADGFVRVIKVPKAAPGQENYEWVDSPIAVLGITGEYAVKTTCLTWVNINRICLGHSDGSISLWSINPLHMLSRRSVHTTHILDIASGYPSHPYHVATSPISGCSTLTDLNLPSAETTHIASPDVNFQCNLLDWNDHLQGFFAMYPTSLPHNTIVGWAHIKYYVQSRMILTAKSPPMCIASGKTHPFTLVGCADGSLWAFNPLRMIMKEQYDECHKLQVLQHELRPSHKIPSMAADKTIRGAARIIQGFRAELNGNARLDIKSRFETWQQLNKIKRPINLRTEGKKRKRYGKKGEGPIDVNKGENSMTLSDEAFLSEMVNKAKVMVHESRTRITVAAWNANVEFGWWAAAAMGSGLVKIMDLGLAGEPVGQRRR